MRDFSVIVAATSGKSGIGMAGALPWRLPGDMAFFKEKTMKTTPCKDTVSSVRKHNDKTDFVLGKCTASQEDEIEQQQQQQQQQQQPRNAVIMGRKTWESIPEKFRPLPNRLNIVISRNENLVLPDEVLVATSLENALTQLTTPAMMVYIENVWVIGGASIYHEALQSSFCSNIWLTSIEKEFDGMDTFFPTIAANKYKLTYYSQPMEEKDIVYRFTRYERLSETFLSGKSMNISIDSNEEEQQYIDTVKDILDHGVQRGDRTGTGTLSKFGVQMRYSLRDGFFPLLTTKRVFWRGVAEELLWFVKGCTNAKELQEKDIHIWDGNGSREFLDSRGLHHLEEGDLGPVYGFQWRHFGAEYIDMHTDYTNKGVDQLKACINTIINNPEDRRIIFSAWNPCDLDKMALPPCHMFCQFYVANGELSLQMYQRSADMGLGVPFNIASYSLLLVIVAQVCNLKPGDFVHTIGDAHVYLNHVDALKEQVRRKPRSFPKIEINPDITDIDKFQFSDFTIRGYAPDKPIKMKMAV